MSDNKGDKEETFIQTVRRAETGRGAERTRGKVVAGGPSEVVDCGTHQAVQQLADPAAPHLHIDKPGGTAGERSRPHNPGLQLGEIKP